MSLRLYDTFTREKRAFVPIDPARVRLYVCGPTVYNYIHIGNARPVVVFDVLFRLLRRLYGEDHVVYAANLTDVDDKINAKVAAEGVAIDKVTSRYIAAYHADISALGALRPGHEPRATASMEAIIALIGRLVRNNAAYVAEGHVLFDTQAYGDYGQLSRRSLDDMIAGARVEVAPYKRHPADFVLWKPSKPGEPSWESPFGSGRPGWHIECTAMIEETLGLPIDIHGGGVDLVFPHHENEMAQGVCAGSRQGYANYWLHNGFVTKAAGKMSKSVGNVDLVRDLLQWAPGEALRWALLASHYRQPLAWTEEAVDQARSALDTLYGALRRVAELPAEADQPSAAFLGALDDDLNTPRANAELFAIARRIETGSAAEKARAKGELLAAGALIGFLQADPETWFQGDGEAGFAERVEAIIAERRSAREAKDWRRADALRDALADLDVEVMDGAGGARWTRKARS